MSENLFPEVKKLNKQVRELLEENERLRSGCVILLGVREIVAENVALRKREASLAAGYRDAIDTMQDACDATGSDQDYQLQIEVDAHRAVLDGVIGSVARYKAHLQHQLDGGQP